jgi:hypothetical protein
MSLRQSMLAKLGDSAFTELEIRAVVLRPFSFVEMTDGQRCMNEINCR